MKCPGCNMTISDALEHRRYCRNPPLLAVDSFTNESLRAKEIEIAVELLSPLADTPVVCVLRILSYAARIATDGYDAKRDGTLHEALEAKSAQLAAKRAANG